MRKSDKLVGKINKLVKNVLKSHQTPKKFQKLARKSHKK